MRDHLYKDSLSSPARRHFLHVMSAVAGAAANTCSFNISISPGVTARLGPTRTQARPRARPPAPVAF